MPGSDEVEIIAFNLVNQQPVRLDVAFAMMAPLAGQRVISTASGQELTLDPQENGGG
jgi:hypothetical protein